MKTVRMKFADLLVLHELQARKRGVDLGVVVQYEANMRDGEQFPPIVAFNITDRNFGKPAVVAGFHRCSAAKRCGITEFDVELHEGTFNEAFVYAFKSNLEHKGLRYSNDDKRRAATIALKLFQRRSARFVAEQMGLSMDFVRRIRIELEGADEVEHQDKVIGADGVAQPRKRSKTKTNPVTLKVTGFVQESECPVAPPEPVSVPAPPVEEPEREATTPMVVDEGGGRQGESAPVEDEPVVDVDPDAEMLAEGIDWWNRASASVRAKFLSIVK